MRVGIGYDSHRFIDGSHLVIGGVTIPFNKSFDAHSDGDVLCHAIIDAILGALGAGDIGTHYPDTDKLWENASSIMLLEGIIRLMRSKKFELVWLDSVIIAEKPRLSHYIDDMKKAISKTGIPPNIISIKAKTNEGMGFIGREQGIAAWAVCLLSNSQ
ncbi:MAG: 2-C-methyl-D-erythritol 2,4-cyclodiphosphate synthase [Thermodesulfovibrionales bacterium]|nr:2-C-methyl-D-erythritol 2,4-cyclodiphosphate synthase [Thermodesulfovibrionales bacterium]